MFYDAPLYGYSEPLIYREERMEQVTVYRWQHVAQTGTVSGLIRWQGLPEAGVDVQITALQMTHSVGNGTFTLKPVPVGDVIVQARKVINGVRMSGQATMHVVADKSTTVVIDLMPPPTVFRRVLIDGTLRTTNHELNAAVDPWNQSDFNGLVNLDPENATHDVRRFECVADDDTLGQLTLSFDLQTDDSVIVNSVIRCYDSNKADTDDYDEAALEPILLPAGTTSHWGMFVDRENQAAASFTFTNEVNPS